ncbi:MAG TPA: TlpA disulfide reductase family protein [Steroidobacteraceae bacterium]|nr:TlpA disulfide reductase family protein [Steroidobacteraceae bacterium]
MELQKAGKTTGWRALAVALLIGTAALAGASSGPRPAPDFTLPVRDGGQISLGELEGQVVMINFWASWCAPCRQEFPLLEQMQQRYESLGFTILGVNVEENTADAERWLAGTDVSFPILFDRENSVSKLYDVHAMPSTVFVDRTGQVRYLHRGYKPGDENEYLDLIRTLVRE